MSDKEIEVLIPEYNGTYAISNKGNVRSLSKYGKNGHLLKLTKTAKGYLRVPLGEPSRHFRVHRLVAKAFLKEFTEGCEINHKDGNKSNNDVDNLEIVTHSKNMFHAYNNGLFKTFPKAKLTWEDVDAIRKSSSSPTELSGLYGVTRRTINDILSHKRWRTEQRFSKKYV